MALTEVFTGAHGTLTLASEDTPEGADAKAIVDTFAIQTVGRLSDVKVRVDTALKEFYEVGRRHPVSLSPGDIAISGTVGRAYVNGALLFLLLGRGATPTATPEPYVQPTFSITLRLSDPARPANSLSLELGGVKFSNWSWSLPEDEFVMENLCFKALTVRVVDRDGSGGDAGGGEAPPTNVAFA
ncbi:hypothetical protein OHA70_10470 [Kribbella sp. NBC_00382]|uniref:hypothetical protein n=1 Tax=Kribbella sp. NBC_00382 TaxID=2975967 RepID=UPI002E2236F2